MSFPPVRAFASSTNAEPEPVEPGTELEKQTAHEHGLRLASRAEVLRDEPLDPRFTFPTNANSSSTPNLDEGIGRQLVRALSHPASHRHPKEVKEEGPDEEPIYVRSLVFPHPNLFLN